MMPTPKIYNVDELEDGEIFENENTDKEARDYHKGNSIFKTPQDSFVQKKPFMMSISSKTNKIHSFSFAKETSLLNQVNLVDENISDFDERKQIEEIEEIQEVKELNNETHLLENNGKISKEEFDHLVKDSISIEHFVTEKEMEIEKDKDKDKEKEKEKEKDAKQKNNEHDHDKTHSDRHPSRERSKDKGSSRHKSERDKDRLRDRGRDRDRERERERDRERKWERERGQERSKSRERGRDRDKSRDRDRKKEKHREKSDVKDRSHNKSKKKERSRRKTERKHKKESSSHKRSSLSSSSSSPETSCSPERSNGEKRKREITKEELSSNEGVIGDEVLMSLKKSKTELPQKNNEMEIDNVANISIGIEEEDEDRLIEERRRRRQQILAKYGEGSHNTDPNQSNESNRHKLNQNQEVISKNDHKSEKGISSIETEGLENENVITGGRMEQFKTETDMFSDDLSEIPIEPTVPILASSQHQNPTLTDNWDDSDGYYRFTIGEVLNNQFQVTSIHGKGVFSTVMKARLTPSASSSNLDPSIQNLTEVAIKVLRNNETMYKTGLKEKEILKKLADNDPENKRHCLRMYTYFEYRNHLCLVLEPMHMNLRDVIKKYGKEEGINIRAVKLYCKQLCTGLKHLKKCNIIHADLKPDNIVVNERLNVLKICDFGSAFYFDEVEVTPYLCSRFYRAPEIILGLTYDCGIDMWAVGCTLIELYTGKIMFKGRTNNEMLKLFIEWRGKFPKKMLKKGSFREEHFDDSFHFLSYENDPISGKEVIRSLPDLDKQRDLASLIFGGKTISSAGTSPGSKQLLDSDIKDLQNFKDMMDQIFTLDPSKRLSVDQALQHPFIV